MLTSPSPASLSIQYLILQILCLRFRLQRLVVNWPEFNQFPLSLFMSLRINNNLILHYPLINHHWRTPIQILPDLLPAFRHPIVQIHPWRMSIHVPLRQSILSHRQHTLNLHSPLINILLKRLQILLFSPHFSLRSKQRRLIWRLWPPSSTNTQSSGNLNPAIWSLPRTKRVCGRDSSLKTGEWLNKPIRCPRSSSRICESIAPKLARLHTHC